MRNLSLRVKLLLLFLVIALAPPIVTGVIGTNITNDLTQQRVVVDEQARLETMAVEVQRFLDTTSSDLRILAKTNTLQNMALAIKDNKSLQLQVLRSAVEEEFINFMTERKIGDEYLYQHVRFLNANGYEFVRIDNVGGQIEPANGSGLNTRAQNGYFRSALNLPDGGVFVSPIVIFDEFGRIPAQYTPVMRYSTPIRSGDTLVGVLVSDVRADGFLNLVASQNRDDTLTYMVDQTGTYIAHPDADKLFGADLGTNANLIADQSDFGFVLHPDQASYTQVNDSLVFYRSIKPPGTESFYWVLVAERPLASIFAIAQQQAGALVVTVVLVAVLVAIAALWVSRLISRPIVELTQAAQSIASGKYSERVRVTNRDEIGTLQTSVNKMAAQIKQSIDTLEERVRDRTHDAEEARLLAENASSAKSEFLSNMSHELRTPLNMVIGYTSSMLNMPQMYDYIPLPEIFRKDIATIQDNGQHLLGLITDILDLSKIEAGKLDLQNQPVNMSEIFKGVIATSIGLIKDKPVQLRQSYADSIPAVWGDPLRIRQIMLNLLSNAIKYTDNGFVTLMAHIEGDRLQIAISDTGMGIPEDALGTIFDRFAQVQNNVAIQGTGLGLDITQRLVQLHGGTLTAESKLGIGSTFRFSLPLVHQEQLARPDEWLPQLMDTRPSKPAPMDWEAIRTILVVVDDSYLRATLHRVLEEANYVVFETNHPAEVQEFATSLTVDLIVLDDDLSARSGFDVLADLKAHESTASVPVLLLTDERSVTHKNGNGTSNGLPHASKKPIQAADLLRKIQASLNKISSQ